MSSDTPADAQADAAASSSASLESRITLPSATETASEPQTSTTDPEKTESTVEKAQHDGAPTEMHGSELREPEYDVDVKLSDLQADPNNPLHSVKTFEELGLERSILNGIYNMNFRSPSKIQEWALPILMHNPPANLIAQSQSGTGKTAAFTLNILHRIDLNNMAPQALILAPSRELARQIKGVVETMGQFTKGLVVTAAIPDPSRRGQKFEGQVIVGTPGTTMDMIRRKLLDPRQIKILVLDEADNMLDQQGLGDQCKRVKALLPRNIQIVLFSATFPQQVIQYATHFAPNAHQMTLKHEELTVEGIKQVFLDCNGEDDKYRVLVQLYGLMTIASSIIFVKRRDTAAEIERRLTQDGHKVAQLSGALEGPQRDEIIDRFRDGRAKVLITTNVLARGIDVQSVSIVVNYDIPETIRGEPDYETYLHRIGRTGRFGRVGVAVNFVHDQDSWQKLAKIAAFFGVESKPLPTDDWDFLEEEIKKILRSSRAGKTTKEMQMQTDGASA
ncbi:RNA helicase required for poly(A+) mRNA export [Coniosporium apollinis]|uniref:RNA helicase n=2 Tax=Coniosporium TaxID=2810619 RepID=A0ABQ9NYU4_9PEZI|nr:RNA helicase required for poly(A+) mRNA export [Cladosporium sp. JES 115]KAJ9665272.1 RNA helicase required for poly(A+) mRNA export [Coniosporium apollinis]